MYMLRGVNVPHVMYMTRKDLRRPQVLNFGEL